MLFTGRLTGNAAIKAVNENKSLVNFTVALNQKWKNKTGEKKEKTVFVDCAYWRNSGIAEYLSKGAVVEISGWIEAQAYQSKNDGLKARLICTCDTIKLFSLIRGSAKPAESRVNKAIGTDAAGTGDEDDDLPF